MGDRSLHITVRLFSYLRENAENPEGIVRLNFPHTAHVKDIFHSLALKDSEISLVMINHHRTKWEEPLRNGDFVEIFPIIGGG